MKKRQGDILFVKVKELPKELSPKKDCIISEGETTGHKHLLVDGELLKDDKENLFINVTAEKATVKHEEHKAITLPAGQYKVIKQREYEPDGWRNVLD